MTTSDSPTGLAGLSGLDPLTLRTLTATARRLAHDYDTSFDAGEVTDVLADSYRLLARTSRVTLFLPTLAERLTRERLEALAATRGLIAKRVPEVLFVCVHNAGRSQMAAAFLTHLAAGRVEVRSAGSMPAEKVNPAAVAAMAEVGIDIAAETPKILTIDAVEASDVVVTMGCGDTCPVFLGTRYEDWKLDDPAGQGIDAVRPIRDDIRTRVEKLLGELLPTA